MRIISQDGTYDLPYEQTSIAVYGTEITGYSLDNTRYCTLARYSTEEKAIKAMEMCRKRYTHYIFNKCMVPVAADNLTGIPLEEAEKIKDQISETFIFQFPKEEEIKDE